MLPDAHLTFKCGFLFKFDKYSKLKFFFWTALVQTQTSNSWWFQEMTLALPSSRSTPKERISPSRASRSSSRVFRFQIRFGRAWSSWNLHTDTSVTHSNNPTHTTLSERNSLVTCSRKAPSWTRSWCAAVSSSGSPASGLRSEISDTEGMKRAYSAYNAGLWDDYIYDGMLTTPELWNYQYLCPCSTKAVISNTAIFVAIDNNTLYESKL